MISACFMKWLMMFLCKNKRSKFDKLWYLFCITLFCLRYKNGTRSSLTFSNQRVREIERDNQRLLAKIMTSGPAGDGAFQKRAPQLSFSSVRIQTLYNNLFIILIQMF